MNCSNISPNFASLWQLSELEAFTKMPHIFKGFQGTKPIVLKLGGDVKALNTEAEALRTFKDCGAVAILNQTDRALLLECVIPGNSLRQFFPTHDSEAVAIASQVIGKLHQSVVTNPNIFPTIGDWLVILNNDYEILSRHLPKARALRDGLLETMGTPILLHGDLHHDNILACGDGWKIIDPKGVIGEPCYEVGCFIRNPLQELPNHHDCLNIITKRIHEFSKNLSLDPGRIKQWCFVQMILSVIWNLEDNLPTENGLKTLGFFEQLLD